MMTFEDDSEILAITVGAQEESDANILPNDGMKFSTCMVDTDASAINAGSFIKPEDVFLAKNVRETRIWKLMIITMR